MPYLKKEGRRKKINFYYCLFGSFFFRSLTLHPLRTFPAFPCRSHRPGGTRFAAPRRTPCPVCWAFAASRRSWLFGFRTAGRPDGEWTTVAGGEGAHTGSLLSSLKSQSPIIIGQSFSVIRFWINNNTVRPRVGRKTGGKKQENKKSQLEINIDKGKILLFCLERVLPLPYRYATAMLTSWVECFFTLVRRSLTK